MSVQARVGVFIGWRLDRLPQDDDEWTAQDALVDQPDGSTSITWPAMGGPYSEPPATFVGRWAVRWDGTDPVLTSVGPRVPDPAQYPDLPVHPSFGGTWTFGAWFVADWT